MWRRRACDTAVLERQYLDDVSGTRNARKVSVTARMWRCLLNAGGAPANPRSRVVTVSSTEHRIRAAIDLEDLQWDRAEALWRSS